MKKRKYNIVFLQEDRTVSYKEVEGYIQKLHLSNGLNVIVGLRKQNDWWYIDDYLTGMAVTSQVFDTRKEALEEAEKYLNIQKDRIKEAREYYISNFNITLNTL